MLTLNDGRSELWQWDTGRKLTVDADCSQVHFSNKVFGRSIDVDAVDGVAVIPDILLQTDKELTAWAFVGTAENGYTKISKVFKVNKRNKPADYVFTEPDQTTLGEILGRIEDLENRPSADISKEDIQNAVNEYLDNNPVSVNEKDPTVPDWAKQPNPPKVEIPDTLPNPHKLTFSGAVSAEYDGSKEVTVEIPDGGSGGNADYKLPIANPETLGGVKPVTKGADMTQKVGVDELGGLWTAPGGADGWDVHGYFNMPEVLDSGFEITEIDGKPLKLKELWATVKLQNGSTSSQWLGCSILNDANEVLTSTGASNGGADTASGGYAYFTYHGFVVGNGRAFVECTTNKTVNNGGGGTLSRHTNRAWLNNWHGYYEISYFKGIKCGNTLGSGTPQGRGTEVEIWGRSV